MTHHRPAHRHRALTRATIGIVGAALTAGIALPAAPPAAARSHNTVSPGDEIDVQHGHSGSRCTLGYAFTDPASRITYGITAGHCNDGNHSPVTDRTTGTAGRFVFSEGTPVEPLNTDFGLVDFGQSRAVKVMYGQPVDTITAIDPSKPVCHDGIRTGISCGHYAGCLSGDQHLTRGMPASIPGDSGGPVWQLGSDGHANIVGIWLGEHNDPDGRFGRFTSLKDVLPALSARARVL